MRRKEQAAARNGVQTAANRVVQRVRAARAAVGKDVVSIAVQHRKMRVHPVARVIVIGLGHETGREAVFAGQSAHQHLEQPRVIGGLERVGLMHKVDLELAQTGLGNRGVGGDVHRLARVIEVREKDIERVQRPQSQRIRPRTAFAGAR